MTHRSHTVEIFTDVAPKYEFLNSLLTAGRDRKWRLKMLAVCESALGRKPETALDLATGTGDVARMMADKWPTAKIVGTDPTTAMLDLAKNRKPGKKLSPAIAKIEWKEGVAEQISFPDNSVDIVTIAFGFRNVQESHRAKAMDEAFRVLKPGGIFAILELGLPNKGKWQTVYKLLLKYGMPRFAAFFGPRNAYDYLAKSILDFPSPENVRKVFSRSGFLAFAPRPLTSGMAWLYIGKKPLTEIH